MKKALTSSVIDTFDLYDSRDSLIIHRGLTSGVMAPLLSLHGYLMTGLGVSH